MTTMIHLLPDVDIRAANVVSISQSSCRWTEYLEHAKRIAMRTLKDNMAEHIRKTITDPILSEVKLQTTDAPTSFLIESYRPIVAWYSMKIEALTPYEPQTELMYSVKPAIVFGTWPEEIWAPSWIWPRGVHLNMSIMETQLLEAVSPNVIKQHYAEYIAREIANVLVRANGHRHIYRIERRNSPFRNAVDIRFDLVDIDDASIREVINNAGRQAYL